ncbi:MAG TPA: hypothetical protein VM537_25390 [Anaerolineae bacterium]|nr:hypothetical protein [Anaerolineae bacterium]
MPDPLAEINRRIQAALALLTTEEADAIIVEPGPGYKELVQGVEAAMGLLWAAMMKGGARENNTNVGYMAKTQVVLLQMLHFAYALGVKRGKEG